MFALIRTGLCFTLIAASSVHAAINITGFSTETNDRFANDPDFFGAGLDFSGVGLAETSGGGRWVTMISDYAFVTANHYSPANGNPVTFYQTNDPLGPSFSTTVASSTRIGSTDIRIGFLNAPLPSSYAYYPIWDMPISGGSGWVSGPNLLTFGRSPTNFAEVSQDMAVGQNQFEIFYSDITVSGTTNDAAVMVFDDPGLTYESQLAGGDSGAPAMLLDGGQLTIVGVNWFIGTIDSGASEISGVSYLPNYQSEINAILPVSVTPVPEWSLSGLAAGLTCLLCCALSRRQRRENPKTPRCQLPV